jgi:hypothetical protein
MASPSSFLPTPQALKARIVEMLATPSLNSYARALQLVEDVVECISHHHAASPHGGDDNDGGDGPTAAVNDDDGDEALLLRDCAHYETMCREAIAKLASRASALEREMYERARSGDVRRRRGGVVFGVDRGEHVAAALEALRLEAFLLEQEQQGEMNLKKVRWA